MNFLKNLFSFWRGVFSETGGSPSAARVIMAYLALVASAVLIILAIAILRSDVGKATAILSSLPMIIGSLSVFIATPYGVNKFAKNPSDTQDKKQ